VTAVIQSNTATQLTFTAPVVGQITGVPYEIAWVANLSATAARRIDNIVGTRGRWIAVARDENANILTVRARDAQNLTSVEIAYRPDYDANPEITSLEVRQLATADPRTVTVRASGIVDDDTRSVTWWVEPADPGEPTRAVPQLINNLAEVKSFVFQTSLIDGTRKALWVRPWSDLAATGVDGVDVVREISRVPRTTVVLENRAASGAISADTARVTFQANPVFLSDTAPYGTGVVTSTTRTTLTDTSKAWPADRYLLNESTFNWFFVQMVDGPAAGKVRRILSNTATQLVTDDWGAGDPPGVTALPVAGNAFRVIRGATWWRRVLRLADGTESSAAWSLTSGREFVSRVGAAAGTAIVLQFYSVVTGVPPESPQSATIDSDTIAEIQGLALNEFTAGVLTVDLQQVDDDVKEWVLFARKGAPPVQLSGTDPLTAPLDQDYLRIRTAVTQQTSLSFAAGAGTWHVVVVPINSYGDAGPRRTAQLTVSGVSVTTAPQIFDVTATVDDGGGTVAHLLRWSHNTPLNSPATGYSVAITAVRADSDIAYLLTSGRAPFLEADPVPAVTSTDATALRGSYRHVISNVTRAGTVPYTWNYLIQLFNGSTLVTSRTVAITSVFSGVEPVLATGLSAALLTGGACVLR
jgi:hypothetical protein